MPQAPFLRCLVLPVAVQARRDGRARCQALEGLGSGERHQEARGGGHARQRSVKGRRAGKILSPQARRIAVCAVRAKLNLSERRACRLLGLSRSVLHYVSQRSGDGLQKRLVELAGERWRFGYRRLHILLGRDGFKANHKRVHRLCRQAALAVRKRQVRPRSDRAVPAADSAGAEPYLVNGLRVRCSGQRRADQVSDGG